MSTAPDPARSNPAVVIAILIAASALNPLAVNIFVPAMPSMMRGLDTNFASVQLVLSAYLFATAGAQLVLGPLSDRFGRRPVLIAGLGIFVIASLICLFAQSIGVMIAGRVLQGMGGCAGIVLGRAMVRDRYERDQVASMLGYVTMGFAVAPMLAPVIGGLIDDNFGWRSIAGLLAALGALVAIVVFLALPETRRPASSGEPLPSLWQGFTTLSGIPAFWAYVLTSAFSTAAFFTFLGGTPFVAIDLLGMSGTEFGLWFMPVSFGFIIGTFVTARYSRRLGINPMITAGNALGLAAMLVMLAALAIGWRSPVALFGPMYVVGFANGLLISNALAGAVSVRPNVAGAASGLAGSTQIGAGAVATVVIGAILGATGSPVALPATMTVFTAAALAFGLWARTARN